MRNARRVNNIPASQVAIGVAALCLLCATGVHATELQTGNPDLSIRWDNTVRYNLGVRVEKQDQRIINNPTYDESDLKFDRGDIVTNRVDLLTEFDLVYQRKVGLRVSASAWYDHAYRDSSVRTNPALTGFVSSYFNDEYNSTVKRYYHGLSGEILDAFVFNRFNLGDIPLDVKLGRHTVYWGEGLLLGAHAMSYSQAPSDGRKAVASPGIEAKEVFLPIAQLSAKAQVTDKLSLAAQYFFEWQPSRLPAGGTYLAPADPFFADPDRLPVGGGRALAHLPSLEPKKRGNFGVSAKWEIDALQGTAGFYYRQFDDYTPWLAPQIGAAGYRLVHAEDVKLYGVSFARTLFGASAGFELSYRENGALNTSSVSAVNNEGPRGNTWHGIVNGIWLLPKTVAFDTGSLVAELAFSHLADVTTNANLFRGEGYGGCVGQDKSFGCATKNYVGMAVNFTPQWLQVRPSVDLEMPMTLNYGISGNAATLTGGNEGALTWSLGLRATVSQRHEFSLRYADGHAQTKYNAAGTVVTGGNGGVSGNDRGYLSFTYKTAF